MIRRNQSFRKILNWITVRVENAFRTKDSGIKVSKSDLEFARIAESKTANEQIIKKICEIEENEIVFSN